MSCHLRSSLASTASCCEPFGIASSSSTTTAPRTHAPSSSTTATPTRTATMKRPFTVRIIGVIALILYVFSSAIPCEAAHAIDVTSEAFAVRSKHFFLFKTTYTLAAASDLCRRSASNNVTGRLAAPYTKEENDALTSMLYYSGGHYAWTAGVQREDRTWAWSQFVDWANASSASVSSAAASSSSSNSSSDSTSGGGSISNRIPDVLLWTPDGAAVSSDSSSQSSHSSVDASSSSASSSLSSSSSSSSSSSLFNDESDSVLTGTCGPTMFCNSFDFNADRRSSPPLPLPTGLNRLQLHHSGQWRMAASQYMEATVACEYPMREGTYGVKHFRLPTKPTATDGVATYGAAKRTCQAERFNGVAGKPTSIFHRNEDIFVKHLMLQNGVLEAWLGAGLVGGTVSTFKWDFPVQTFSNDLKKCSGYYCGFEPGTLVSSVGSGVVMHLHGWRRKSRNILSKHATLCSFRLKEVTVDGAKEFRLLNGAVTSLDGPNGIRRCANSWFQGRRGTVAVPHSAGQARALVSLITNYLQERCWVGANDVGKENQWVTAAGHEYYNATSRECRTAYCFWRRGEPNNHKGGEDYAELWATPAFVRKGTEGLNDISGSTVRQTICEYPFQIAYTPTKHFQLLNTGAVSFMRARQACRDRGMRLATVATQSEQNTLVTLWKAQATKDAAGLTIWLGGFRISGSWYWLDVYERGSTNAVFHDGSECTQYCAFPEGYLGGDSMALSLTHRATWRPVSINDHHYPICEPALSVSKSLSLTQPPPPTRTRTATKTPLPTPTKTATTTVMPTASATVQPTATTSLLATQSLSSTRSSAPSATFTMSVTRSGPSQTETKIASPTISRSMTLTVGSATSTPALSTTMSATLNATTTRDVSATASVVSTLSQTVSAMTMSRSMQSSTSISVTVAASLSLSRTASVQPTTSPSPTPLTASHTQTNVVSASVTQSQPPSTTQSASASMPVSVSSTNVLTTSVTKTASIDPTVSRSLPATPSATSLPTATTIVTQTLTTSATIKPPPTPTSTRSTTHEATKTKAETVTVPPPKTSSQTATPTRRPTPTASHDATRSATATYHPPPLPPPPPPFFATPLGIAVLVAAGLLLLCCCLSIFASVICWRRKRWNHDLDELKYGNHDDPAGAFSMWGSNPHASVFLERKDRTLSFVKKEEGDSNPENAPDNEEHRRRRVKRKPRGLAVLGGTRRDKLQRVKTSLNESGDDTLSGARRDQLHRVKTNVNGSGDEHMLGGARRDKLCRIKTSAGEPEENDDMLGTAQRGKVQRIKSTVSDSNDILDGSRMQRIRSSGASDSGHGADMLAGARRGKLQRLQRIKTDADGSGGEDDTLSGVRLDKLQRIKTHVSGAKDDDLLGGARRDKMQRVKASAEDGADGIDLLDGPRRSRMQRTKAGSTPTDVDGADLLAGARRGKLHRTKTSPEDDGSPERADDPDEYEIDLEGILGHADESPQGGSTPSGSLAMLDGQRRGMQPRKGALSNGVEEANANNNFDGVLHGRAAPPGNLRGLATLGGARRDKLQRVSSPNDQDGEADSDGEQDVEEDEMNDADLERILQHGRACDNGRDAHRLAMLDGRRGRLNRVRSSAETDAQRDESADDVDCQTKLRGLSILDGPGSRGRLDRIRSSVIANDESGAHRDAAVYSHDDVVDGADNGPVKPRGLSILDAPPGRRGRLNRVRSSADSNARGDDHEANCSDDDVVDDEVIDGRTKPRGLSILDGPGSRGRLNRIRSSVNAENGAHREPGDSHDDMVDGANNGPVKPRGLSILDAPPGRRGRLNRVRSSADSNARGDDHDAHCNDDDVVDEVIDGQTKPRGLSILDGPSGRRGRLNRVRSPPDANDDEGYGYDAVDKEVVLDAGDDGQTKLRSMSILNARPRRRDRLDRIRPASANENDDAVAVIDGILGQGNRAAPSDDRKPRGMSILNGSYYLYDEAKSRGIGEAREASDQVTRRGKSQRAQVNSAREQDTYEHEEEKGDVEYTNEHDQGSVSVPPRGPTIQSLRRDRARQEMNHAMSDDDGEDCGGNMSDQHDADDAPCRVEVFGSGSDGHDEDAVPAPPLQEAAVEGDPQGILEGDSSTLFGRDDGDSIDIDVNDLLDSADEDDDQENSENADDLGDDQEHEAAEAGALNIVATAVAEDADADAAATEIDDIMEDPNV